MKAVVPKKCSSEKRTENFQENVHRSVQFLKFYLVETSRQGWFPEIYEMLKNSYSKEYSRAASFKIPYKSSLFFNKNVGCSSNTLTGIGPAN